MARRTWLFTLCLWLSLATVLGHALVPVSSPLTQKSGSAFSAGTWEVSLGAGRTGFNAKLKRQSADDQSGSPDPVDIVLLAAAPTLPEPGSGPSRFPARTDDAPAPFGPGGGFQARAPPRA